MKKYIATKFVLSSKFVSMCLIFSTFIFLFFPFISAGYGYNSDSTILNIGTFNQGSNIELIQTSSNGSAINITTIKFPDGSLVSFNEEMTKDGTFYNWTLSSSRTYLIGEYIVNGAGDEGVWNYKFVINGGNIGFFIILFVVCYGLTFYGLKIQNEWVSLLGCFGLLFLGIHTSFNGIDLYKNEMTRAISYITIAVGLGIGFEALMAITEK